MKIKYLWISLLLLTLAVPAQAKLVEKNIGYRQGGDALEGYLVYDDSFKGKRPGILVVHEWWGLNSYARSRAMQLAATGYVAFALDMYGKGKVTKHPKQAAEWMNAINQNVGRWRDRALAGLAVLKQSPKVDPDRIAAIGYCFGGATVQQLAYSGADLKGVVSFHGALVPPVDVQASGVSAKLLICHGAADPFAKPEQVQAFLAAMEKSGLDWEMVFYGGAKHSFTNPGADKVGMAALAYDASADKRSWVAMKQFFSELF